MGLCHQAKWTQFFKAHERLQLKSLGRHHPAKEIESQKTYQTQENTRTCKLPTVDRPDHIY